MERSRPRRLTRSNDRILGGVAAGIGDYLDVDPTLVRIGWVFAVTIGLPLALIGYLGLWLLMPASEESGRDEVAASNAGESSIYEADSGQDNSARLLGIVLVVVGAVFLLPDFDIVPWFGWRLIHLTWPVLLIGVGLLLLMRSSRSTS